MKDPYVPWSLLFAWAISLLMFAGLLLITGCDEKSSAQKSQTNVGFGIELRTIEHDKHSFVVGYTGKTDGGLSIMHHPDCPCLRKTPVEK